MSISENLRKRQLECLRLAAELRQLASETSDPDLRAQFHRTAAMWTSQAERDDLEDGMIGSTE